MSEQKELAEQEGMEKGLKKGLKEGMEKGREERTKEIVRKALTMGLPKSEIAKLMQLSEDDIDVIE